MMIGAVVGALLGGPLADFLGRRGLAIFGSLLCMLGNLLLVAADEMAKIYAGRTLVGISVGMLSMVVPLYLTEIATPSSRGRFIAFHQLCIVLGISVDFWITFGCTSLQTSRSWRIPLGVQLIPNAIYAIGLFFVPQSPRYLIQKHRDKEAIRTLAMIRGDGSTRHRDVLMEFAEIKQRICFEERYTKKGYKELFRRSSDNNLRRLVLACASLAFQQLTGANTLMLYSPVIFRAIGLNGHVATLFANAISGSVIVVATMLPVFLIDRWHRRHGMIAGAVLSALWMAILSAISSVYGSRFAGMADFYDHLSDQTAALFLHEPRASSVAFFVIFYLFLATYGCFWAPLGWIYPAELFPNGVRAKGFSIATAVNWFFTFGVTELSPIALTSIQWKVFLIYCIFSICIAIIVYLYFPETKGMSLEEIDLLFSANFRFYDPNLPHPRAATETLEQIDERYIKGRRVLQFGHDYPTTSSPEPSTLPEDIVRNPTPIL
ncbi:general substrate transporter [Lichtheimia corymbifera JMRC:FSU:9682]|uniref:General substrate transporter n=1 Tax=Lichtheimia corymbifera JMRC:FSU:9682 TaxID=1263082 RepID=A0A068RLP5_9FUNG|nr:general substrate transporter [Lichtheimia corymbifera JMRC:FSU:9682]